MSDVASQPEVRLAGLKRERAFLGTAPDSVTKSRRLAEIDAALVELGEKPEPKSRRERAVQEG